MYGLLVIVSRTYLKTTLLSNYYFYGLKLSNLNFKTNILDNKCILWTRVLEMIQNWQNIGLQNVLWTKSIFQIFIKKQQFYGFTCQNVYQKELYSTLKRYPSPPWCLVCWSWSWRFSLVMPPSVGNYWNISHQLNFLQTISNPLKVWFINWISCKIFSHHWNIQAWTEFLTQYFQIIEIKW